MAGVALVTRFAPVLIINPSLPARDLKDFAPENGKHHLP